MSSWDIAGPLCLKGQRTHKSLTFISFTASLPPLLTTEIIHKDKIMYQKKIKKETSPYTYLAPRQNKETVIV